ncbi:hypothetical protein LXA43DRAFT_1089565 [Ganoderma leucocontextum]|nr:hypothetical protein LXA43DRAFT_1089565 [Ganoderma leucocontextum]
MDAGQPSSSSSLLWRSLRASVALPIPPERKVLRPDHDLIEAYGHLTVEGPSPRTRCFPARCCPLVLSSRTCPRSARVVFPHASGEMRHLPARCSPLVLSSQTRPRSRHLPARVGGDAPSPPTPCLPRHVVSSSVVRRPRRLPARVIARGRSLLPHALSPRTLPLLARGSPHALSPHARCLLTGVRRLLAHVHRLLAHVVSLLVSFPRVRQSGPHPWPFLSLLMRENANCVMGPPLSTAQYKMFAILFRIGGRAHAPIRWTTFEKSMRALDFAIVNQKGTMHRFVAPEGLGGGTLSLRKVLLLNHYIYANDTDLHVPTLVRDMYSEISHNHEQEAGREERLARLEWQMGKVYQAVGCEAGSEEEDEEAGQASGDDEESDGGQEEDDSETNKEEGSADGEDDDDDDEQGAEDEDGSNDDETKARKSRKGKARLGGKKTSSGDKKPVSRSSKSDFVKKSPVPKKTHVLSSSSKVAMGSSVSASASKSPKKRKAKSASSSKSTKKGPQMSLAGLPSRPTPDVLNGALQSLEDEKAASAGRSSDREARRRNTGHRVPRSSVDFRFPGVRDARVTAARGARECSHVPPSLPWDSGLPLGAGPPSEQSSNVGDDSPALFSPAFMFRAPSSAYLQSYEDGGGCDLSPADDILLMHDTTNKGILFGHGTYPGFGDASDKEDDLVSVLSDLTDLDELEKMMGIATPSQDVPFAIPAKRRRKEWDDLKREQQLALVIMGLNRTAYKVAREAQWPSRTTVFAKFNLQDAVNKPDKKKAQGSVMFDGEYPRRAVSGDRYDLVYHFPGALRGRTLEDFTAGAYRWAEVAPISATMKNDFMDAYRDGDFVGQTQLCQFWHAPGHQNQDAQVGRQIRQTGPSFRGTFRAMKDFAVVAAFCNTILATIDPLQHKLLWDVRERRMTNPEWAEQPIFKTYNPTLLWECCEVVYNWWSPPHRDYGDPHFAWAGIVYFGTFKDAWFSFPRLGLRVRLRPGDVVFFRGKDLVHAVADWGDVCI